MYSNENGVCVWGGGGGGGACWSEHLFCSLGHKKKKWKIYK
jgi:hypothetical protein